MKDIIMEQTINYAIGLGHTTIVSEFFQKGVPNKGSGRNKILSKG